MAAFKVTIARPLSFPADKRIRCGITVTKQDGYEGPLTDEQLEAVKADNYLVVEEVKGEKPQDAPAEPVNAPKVSKSASK